MQGDLSTQSLVMQGMKPSASARDPRAPTATPRGTSKDTLLMSTVALITWLFALGLRR